jgi:uncharacterized protein YbaR (Trm112 family)
MRRNLNDILACPVCKGPLTLTVEEEGAPLGGEPEVLRGSLRCPTCDHDYPIEDGIPNLLPPDFAAQETPSGGHS